MQTILVAVDGSDHADRALGIAGDLALRHEAKLVIVHVVHPEALLPEQRHLAESEHLTRADAEDIGVSAGVPTWIREAIADREHTAEDARVAERIGGMILERAESAAQRAGCANLELVSESGDAADAIVACAERAKADAVVLGTRGLGGLSELLLGSVSHAVAQRLACTVIMVK